MRRIVVCIACIAGLGVLVGCGGSSGGGGGSSTSTTTAQKVSGPVNVSTWGGVWTDGEQRDFGTPFTQETGVKVNYQVAGTSPMAPALLQAQSGNVSLDVVDAENAEVLRARGLLATFPPDLMQTIQSTSRPGTYLPYVLNLGSTATVIACNPSVMKRCPTTPQQFWDVKDYPGPRAILNQPSNALYFALVADGVAPDRVFPMDLNRGIKKLQEIKPSVKVWPSSGSDQQQALIDKTVGAAIMWNGRAFVVKRDNIPNLQISWTDALTSRSDGLVVLKDAPHKDAAFAYIRWILEHPRNQAAWTQSLTYPTPTTQLEQLVPRSIWEALPASHQVVKQDDAWLAAHTADIQRVWQGLLAG